MGASSKKAPTPGSFSGTPPLGSAQFRFAEMMESNKDAIVQKAASPLDVSEVEKHKSEGDCWSIYKGNVYDITRYLDIHPGGRQHLLDYAGKDLTEEFLSVHPWVNGEFLLKSLHVGELKTDSENTASSPSRNTSGTSN
ncbi:cytochrome b5-like heme steroid binding domain-containing protein [Babesia ovata]|uniref:Cytochrome b5-like heme steroid binding domain-containing protein n=1 Tax=Babesia ovata TaxID=189622 RepID=A0A2H6KHE6_9APIC|nr:cytochrome b5-like heme steroid binding domain-containing protein [Babesia ovata]GBE62415.1 cytochrome b5-like heme steroid binding domain-containing protein [Babesia ovata]